MKSSMAFAEDRKRDGPSSTATGRRSGSIAAWTSLAIVGIALVKSATGKVPSSGVEDFSVRAMASCSGLGFFIEWAQPPNALGSEGVCLLCICKDERSALCWQRQRRRCELTGPGLMRSKRVRRSSFLGSILKPTIMERNQQKFKTGPCKPYHGSYSVGCPPDDWCVGCTVCDCNAEGRWDCHLLSFCGNKNKKQKQILKKLSPKQKVNPSYMKNFVNAAKRQTTKKPKVLKRKAPMKTTKKPAFKPKAKPVLKPKPKPKRSIKQQNIPASSLGYKDSALAQEVVKRVMATIQEMTHKKYGIRPELRRMLLMTTKKPNLKFKKITKKPTPPKPKMPPPKSKPKPAPKLQPKKPMKKSMTKITSQSTSKPQLQRVIPKSTTIKKRPQKKLEEEIQKIIAKAASKLHKQNARSKRELTENYAPRIINDTTPSFMILKLAQTTDMYETKDYNLPSGNGQENFYEYSTAEDKFSNVQGIENEDYHKYSIAAAAEIIDTTGVYTDANKDMKNQSNGKLLESLNTSNESSKHLPPSIIDKTNVDKIYFPVITEEYSQNNSIDSKGKEKNASVLLEKTDLITNEAKLNKIKMVAEGKPLANNTKTNYDDNAGSFNPTKTPYKDMNKTLERDRLQKGNVLDETKILYFFANSSNQTDVPEISKTTATYPHIERKIYNESTIVPEMVNSTTNEATINEVDSKKKLSNSTKALYFSDYSRSTSYDMLTNKRIDKGSESYVTTDNSINIHIFRRTNETHKIDKVNYTLIDTFTKNDSKNSNNESIRKTVPLAFKHKVENNQSLSVFQNLLKDPDLHTTVTKEVYIKVPATNFSVQNYFRSLLRYILSRTKEERKNLRNNLLEKEQFNKFEFIDTVCQNIGPCNLTRTKKLLMKPILKELRTETDKIFKTIQILKGLFHLLDMPHENDHNQLNKTGQLESDIAKLKSIVKGTYEKNAVQLTETEIIQINVIKHNIDIFINSVGNFASTLNRLIEILTSEIRSKVKHRRIRADADREKQKVQTLFKRIKAVLKEHDMVENSLTDALYHNLTKNDRNDILHLIYRNSDIMDNYKFRLLEILGKLKGVLGRIENIKAERRYKAMLEAEKKADEKKKADKIAEIELKKKLKKAAKKKQELAKKRKQMEGIPIWNMGRPDRRRKRQLVDERVYEYLLMIMEFLLRQNYFAYNNPSVHDGIDILVRAIQETPDITPMGRSRPIVHNIPKKTKTMKRISKKPNGFSPTMRNDGAKIANIKPAIDNVDYVDLKSELTKQLLHQNENVKSVADIEDSAFRMPHYVAEDDDDLHEHRHERQLNVAKLKKANEKLIQFTAEDPVTTNFEKIMEKTVHKRVSLIKTNDSHKADTDYVNNKHVHHPKEAGVKNIKSKSREDTTTGATVELTVDSPILPPILKESGTSEVHITKVKSSHNIRQHDDEDVQYPKPKLVWVSDALKENNAVVGNYPNATRTRSTSTKTSTPAYKKLTTDVLISSTISVALSSTGIPSRKIKRNTSSSKPTLRRKPVELPHNLDYDADRYPPVSKEETAEEY